MAENIETRESQQYEFDLSRVTIGRGEHTDVIIRDRSLLDVHAIIEFDGEQACFVHFDSSMEAVIGRRTIPARTLSKLDDPTELMLTRSTRLWIATRAPEAVLGNEPAPIAVQGAVPLVASPPDETLSMPIRLVPGESDPELDPAPTTSMAATTSGSTEAGAQPEAAPSLADAPEAPAVTNGWVLQPGMRIAENYEVVRPLGIGGMGAVYKGIDHRRRREIAIKVIAPSHVSSPNALGRFEREVAAAAAVHHPNIAEIYDSGVSNGMPFIVMQYVRGDDLATVLERERLEIPRAVDLMLSLCAAVQAVHDRSVVHRDLKPENVKVVKERRGETAVLLDFGVAKVLGSHHFFGADPKLTAADAIVGSVDYMAPEQTSASPHVDFAADQYAIGVILYRCLTQRLPFEAPNSLAVIRKIIEGVFAPPSVHRPEIPAKLEEVILRALSRYPEDRFPSVDKLGEALLGFASERGRRLWMDELTAPNRPQMSGAIPMASLPAGAEISTVAAAGGTLVLPGSLDPRLARTQLLPAPANDRRTPEGIQESGPRPRRSLMARGLFAVTGMAVIAVVTGVIVRHLSPKEQLAPPKLAGPVSNSPRGVPVPPPAATPQPAPAPPIDSEAANDPAAIESRSPQPLAGAPASAARVRPARKSKVRRHPRVEEESAAPPLPTETPNHVKLIY